MDKSPDAFRTISEVAELLETPAHVLRFWESRFPQIKPVKRAGGRRYYRPADLALLTGIRRLLHDEGLTIRGVQKILREQGVRHVSGLSEEDEAGFASDDSMEMEEEDATIASDPIPLFPAATSPVTAPSHVDTPATDMPVPQPDLAAGPPDKTPESAAQTLEMDLPAAPPEAEIPAPSSDDDVAEVVPNPGLPAGPFPAPAAEYPRDEDAEESAAKNDAAHDDAEHDDAEHDVADAAYGPTPTDDRLVPSDDEATVSTAPAAGHSLNPELPFDTPFSPRAEEQVESPKDSVAQDTPTDLSGPFDTTPAETEPKVDAAPEGDAAPPPTPAVAAKAALPHSIPSPMPPALDITGHWLPADLRALRKGALIGKTDKAAALFQRLEALRNRVGDRGRVPRR